MSTGARICGVVLAAGAGRRMGRPKADLLVDGQRLLDRATGLLTAAGCSPVCAVVRDGSTAIADRTVVNTDPERGMRSSLELGVAAAGDVDAVAVVLVDTPGLTAGGVRDVIGAWRPGRIAVARYGGQRGHPTVMSVDLWRRALVLAGPDEGGRAFLAAEPSLVDPVDVPGSPVDLDTPGDLAEWLGRSAER